MRSQILPPVLCLLLALIFSSGPSFSAMKVASTKLKTPENKGVSSKIAGPFYFDNEILSKQHKEAENSHNNASLNQLPSVLNLQENTHNEEFSYNYINESNVGIAINTQEEKIDLAESQTLFKNGMFYGFTIMVILLNIVCFFLFDEKIFLLYSLALTSITASFMFGDSIFELLGASSVDNFAALQSTLLLIATAFGALFASKYLTLQEFFPKLKYFALGLIGFGSMMVFSSWISETWLFTGIANACSLTVMGIYFSAGIVQFSKKNYAKFYVIAYSIPVLFALDFFVLRNIGFDFLFTENFHLKAATFVQMLIITYAIMYRMRAIKEEHLLRQTEMRIFLKRQEVLNRTNAEKLMQDIYLENLIMHYDLDGFEIKLLQYISEGKDNAKIARKLKTTELEVEEHTKELYEKLDIGEQIQEDYRMIETQPDYIYN